MKTACIFMLVIMLFSTKDLLSKEIDCKEMLGQCVFSNLLQRQSDKEASYKETSDQAYCDLKKPPKEAYPLESHCAYFFSFPRIIPDHFSGCHTFWSEKGKKIRVVRFKNSEPISEEHYKEDGTSVICEVKEKEYEKDGEVCLSAEGVRRSMKIILPTKPDPQVPAERDPRG